MDRRRTGRSFWQPDGKMAVLGVPAEKWPDVLYVPPPQTAERTPVSRQKENPAPQTPSRPLGNVALTSNRQVIYQGSRGEPVVHQ